MIEWGSLLQPQAVKVILDTGNRSGSSDGVCNSITLKRETAILGGLAVADHSFLFCLFCSFR